MPPLLKQRKVIPMVSGTDQSADAYVGDTLASVENAEWVQRYATRKRHGFVSLSNSVDVSGQLGSDVRAMFATGKELCVVDGTKVVSWNADLLTWLTRPGYVSPFTVEIDTEIRDEMSYPQCDMAQLNGWRLVVASVFTQVQGAAPADYTGMSWSVYADSGKQVSEREVVKYNAIGAPPSAHAVRATSAGNKLLALYMDQHTAPCNISGKSFDTTTYVAASHYNIITDCDVATTYIHNVRMYDAICCTQDTSVFHLAYIQAVTGNIIVQRMTSAMAVTHTLTISDHAPYKRVSLCNSETGSRVYVVGVGTGAGEGAPVVIDLTRASRDDLVFAWNVLLVNPVLGYNTVSATPIVDNIGVVETHFTYNGATEQRVLVTYSNRYSVYNLNPHTCVVTCDTSGGDISSVKWALNQVPITKPWGDSTTYEAYVACAIDQAAGFEENSPDDGAIRLASSNSGMVTHRIADLFSATNTNEMPFVAAFHHYGTGPLKARDTNEHALWCGSCNNVVAYEDLNAYGAPRVSYAVQTRTQSAYDNTTANRVLWAHRWGVDIVTLDSEGPIKACAVYDRCAVIGGGVVSWYDGGRAFEMGHLHAPRITQVDINNVDTVANAELQDEACAYIASYESRDSSGVLHRGPPTGATATLTPVAPTNAINVRVLLTSSTNRANRVGGSTSMVSGQLGIVLYRSENGGTYQRALPPTYSLNNNVNSDGGVGEVPWVTYLDEGHVSGDALYVLSGELDASSPPPAAFPSVINERLWLTGCARSSEAWPSKKFYVSDGVRVAPEMHPSIAIHSPGEERMISAVQLDDKQIILTSSRTYILAGLGPDDAGQNNDWGNLVLVSADVGCKDARSVVATPAGVFWQAQTGSFVMLDRGLQLRHVGEAVRDETDAYPTVTSAVLVAHKNQVRFTVTTEVQVGNGVAGHILVYDYRIGAWAKWSPKAAVDVTYPVWIDAAVFDGVYYVLSKNGLVAYESDIVFYDAIGSGAIQWISHAIETDHITAAGMGGWKRAWAWNLLLRRLSAHKLMVELSVDKEDEPSKTYPYSNADILKLPELPLEELRPEIHRQLSQAQKVRFYDLAPSQDTRDWGNGEGFVCTGIVLEYGVQPRGIVFPKAARS